MCGPPARPLTLPLRLYLPFETLRLGELPQIDFRWLWGRKTLREKDPFGRQISARGIPSQRGETVAINTVIKLGFIGIIIIIHTIISTSTIITTPLRCRS